MEACNKKRLSFWAECIVIGMCYTMCSHWEGLFHMFSPTNTHSDTHSHTGSGVMLIDVPRPGPLSAAGSGNSSHPPPPPPLFPPPRPSSQHVSTCSLPAALLLQTRLKLRQIFSSDPGRSLTLAPGPDSTWQELMSADGAGWVSTFPWFALGQDLRTYRPQGEIGGGLFHYSMK